MPRHTKDPPAKPKCNESITHFRLRIQRDPWAVLVCTPTIQRDWPGAYCLRRPKNRVFGVCTAARLAIRCGSWKLAYWLAGWSLLGERLGPYAWLGGVLILGAAIILTTRGHEPEPAVILE